MIVEYILCLGIAMIVAALTVYFRDLQYILGIVTMALQYMTPVMYGSEMVPDWALPIFKANPMTPIIEMYREILYYKLVPNLTSLLYVLVIGILFIAIGFLCFNKLQKGFAENF
jgi:ABC-2 type transport system permease protein